MNEPIPTSKPQHVSTKSTTVHFMCVQFDYFKASYNGVVDEFYHELCEWVEQRDPDPYRIMPGMTPELKPIYQRLLPDVEPPTDENQYLWMFTWETSDPLSEQEASLCKQLAEQALHNAAV